MVMDESTCRNSMEPLPEKKMREIPMQKRCETCAIPWDQKQLKSVLNRNYTQAYPDCPLQAIRDAVGPGLVGTITSKISCSGWKQILCNKCGNPIEGTACDYCGRPTCIDCLRVEEDLDEQS